MLVPTPDVPSREGLMMLFWPGAANLDNRAGYGRRATPGGGPKLLSFYLLVRWLEFFDSHAGQPAESCRFGQNRPADSRRVLSPLACRSWNRGEAGASFQGRDGGAARSWPFLANWSQRSDNAMRG